jgi:hypothetical protein
MMRDFHDDDGNGANHKGRRHKGESRESAPTPMCVIRSAHPIVMTIKTTDSRPIAIAPMA